MRLPRLRFTIRRLMLVVALGGIVVWGVKLWRQSREYAARVHLMRSQESDCRRSESQCWKIADNDDEIAHLASVANVPNVPADSYKRSAAQWRQMAAEWSSMADYRAALARKYERAAHYPWLPVEPDPPEP